MTRVGILSLRWATAAIVGAVLVPAQVLRAQGPDQGIRVHGHWVVEVRNADGTLEHRREFENALRPSGRDALAKLLSGQTPVPVFGWFVDLGSNSNLCTPGICRIAEPGSTYSTSFKNLTKTVTNAGELVLQGSFVPSRAGQVTDVSTIIFLPGILSSGAFTAKQISGIPVQATQTVSVTVTFSFN